jgi:hypothetical protein
LLLLANSSNKKIVNNEQAQCLSTFWLGGENVKWLRRCVYTESRKEPNAAPNKTMVFRGYQIFQVLVHAPVDQQFKKLANIRPLLKIGVTNESFHASGKTEVAKDLLKIMFYAKSINDEMGYFGQQIWGTYGQFKRDFKQRCKLFHIRLKKK